MSRLEFLPKTNSEVLTYTITFVDVLQVGETIASATFGVSTYSGTDNNTAAMLSGAVTHTDTTVKQTITGGVVGVTYVLNAKATTSLGNVLQKEGFLVVLASP